MDHSQHTIANQGHMLSTDTSNDPIHQHDLMTSTASNMDSMAINSQHHHKGYLTVGGMNHMMSMAFHFGCNETILFSGWKIETVSGLIGSMIAIFIMATLYEGLKYYREYLFWKTYNLLEYRTVSLPEKGTDEQRHVPSIHYVGEVIHKKPPSILSMNHLYQTFLHVIQVALSFLLMLIFMTYNVWLSIAVIFGATVGYFLFCWKKSVIVDVTEHCHYLQECLGALRYPSAQYPEQSDSFECTFKDLSRKKISTNHVCPNEFCRYCQYFWREYDNRGAVK